MDLLRKGNHIPVGVRQQLTSYRQHGYLHMTGTEDFPWQSGTHRLLFCQTPPIWVQLIASQDTVQQK
jgi:hypothetical protein